VKKLFINFIKFYQDFISPIIGGKNTCRFTPTCSEYTLQAIEKYGAVRGTLLGIKRISKCHPGGKFGYDPVP